MSHAAARAADVRGLASEQAGLLTRAQLRKAGFASYAVRNNVAAGRWQVLSRRVVALHTGPLSDEQTAWFAVLDGGEDCVLAGLTALHQQGLKGFPVERLQAAVPMTGRGGRHGIYVRRRTQRLTELTRHPSRQPPMMRVPTALVDALEHMDLPLRGCALLAAVVQQRLIRRDDIRPLVMAERTLPRRRLYTAVTGDIEGGAESLVEIDFAGLARRAGIDPPRRQAVRLDRDGRRRYLDVDFDGYSVEVDGALHLKPLNWWDDMFRQNAMVIGGKPMLRFASVGIRLQSHRVMAQLRAAAERWPG